MKTIKEFVAHIISGDNIAARDVFHSLIAEKSIDALAERKQEIAQNLFQTEAKKEKEEDDEDDEESCEMKNEALANWNDSAGEFTHSKTGKHFTYRETKNPWALKHGLRHEVSVGPNAEGTRFANIKGTVAHVAVDENPDGTPDIEKWTINNHRRHAREEIELEEGNTKNKQMKNAHFDRMGAKWKELNPQHDFSQNDRNLGRGVNAYGNKKQVKAAQQYEETEPVNELSVRTLSSYVKKRAKDLRGGYTDEKPLKGINLALKKVSKHQAQSRNEETELDEASKSPMYDVVHPKHGVIGVHSADGGFIPSKPHLGFKSGKNIPSGSRIDRSNQISNSPYEMEPPTKTNLRRSSKVNEETELDEATPSEKLTSYMLAAVHNKNKNPEKAPQRLAGIERAMKKQANLPKDPNISKPKYPAQYKGWDDPEGSIK